MDVWRFAYGAGLSYIGMYDGHKICHHNAEFGQEIQRGWEGKFVRPYNLHLVEPKSNIQTTDFIVQVSASTSIQI